MINKASNNKKRIIFFVVFALLWVTFLFTHLWKLDSVFDIWCCDEVGLVDNVIAIRDHGTDRYGNSYPAYFLNFDSGQSALYTYSYLPFLILFGAGKLSARLVIVVYAAISLIYWIRTFFYLEIDKYKNSLLIMAIMALCPVYILLFRIALDCNLMLAVTPIFLYYLIRAIDSGKTKYYILASIACVLILYSYVLSHIILPVFLGLLFIYMLINRKVSIKNTVVFFGIIVALAWPLVLFQIVDAMKISTINIGKMSITGLGSNRRSEVLTSNALVNAICAIVPVFGCDDIPYSSIVYFGNYYWILVPFVIVGLVACTRKAIANVKEKKLTYNELIVAWFYIVYLCDSILAVNVYRVNPIFVSTAYFLIEGLKIAYSKVSYTKYRKVVISLFAALVIGSVCAFSWYYYGGEYSKNYQHNYCSGYDMTEALERVEEIRQDSDRNLYISYVRCAEEYFMYAKGIDSRDYFFENGIARRFEDTQRNYNNNYFFIPDAIDVNGIYMLDESSLGTRDWLISNGYNCELVGHYYVLFR